jgi:hypothetical protein
MMMYQHYPTLGIKGGVFFPNPPLYLTPEGSYGVRAYETRRPARRRQFPNPYNDGSPNGNRSVVPNIPRESRSEPGNVKEPFVHPETSLVIP